MGDKSTIEWCDATWNCLRGCTRVSEGCRNCYAENIAYRFSGAGQPYEGLAVLKNGHASWTGKVAFIEEHLLDPIRWRSPRKIFVNSMSDVFHDKVEDETIDKMFAVMALSPQHTFQILTKRPQRMLVYMTDNAEERVRDLVAFESDKWNAHKQAIALGGKWNSPQIGDFGRVELAGYYDDCKFDWPLKNVWLGTSVENQAAADERIPLLCQTPAAIRFISAEPLLGPLDLEWPKTMYPDGPPMCCSGLPNECGCMGMPTDPPLLYGLDQIIVGGESGHGARPMNPGWAISLRDQCKRWRVSFFMKQMGSVYGEHKGKDLPDDLNIREFPGVTA